uniref:Uncharacterized protein n=1 Tax=Arundo donax TaxID=35708 RepID=A0A0A9AYW5_ARUDO
MGLMTTMPMVKIFHRMEMVITRNSSRKNTQAQSKSTVEPELLPRA